ERKEREQRVVGDRRGEGEVAAVVELNDAAVGRAGAEAAASDESPRHPHRPGAAVMVFVRRARHSIDYSRNTTAGSSRDARDAGTNPATRATPTRMPVAMTMVSGSVGSRPKSSERTSRPSIIALAAPASTPAATTHATS